MLELIDLGQKIGDRWIFRNLNERLPAGVHVVVGPNGCGKSTLIKTLAGLLPAAEGLVRLNGLELFSQPLHKRRVGYVPQTRLLFPHLTVRENLFYSGRKSDSRDEELIELFELGDKLHLRPAQLSGGLRSRVALLRALLARPQLLLADEPMSDQDPAAKARILGALRQILPILRIPVIWVTHDPIHEESLGNAVRNGFLNPPAQV